MCGEWAGLEAEAKSSGAGLWADKDPTPPWQRRRDEKGSSMSSVEKFCRKRSGCCSEGHPSVCKTLRRQALSGTSSSGKSLRVLLTLVLTG